jgi:hypothetical protein
MFEQQTTGSPMKWFLESTAVSLNYLKSPSAATASLRIAPFT